MMMIFSSLAWNNIGHINWEPWLPQVSECLSPIMRNLLLLIRSSHGYFEDFPFQLERCKSLLKIIHISPQRHRNGLSR